MEKHVESESHCIYVTDPNKHVVLADVFKTETCNNGTCNN